MFDGETMKEWSDPLPADANDQCRHSAKPRPQPCDRSCRDNPHLLTFFAGFASLKNEGSMMPVGPCHLLNSSSKSKQEEFQRSRKLKEDASERLDIDLQKRKSVASVQQSQS